MKTSSVAPSVALKIDGLVKRFGANTALGGVSIEVTAGSIHALLGMNGSGKSTIVKILSGYHHPDDGVIEVGFNHESDRVAFVHQDLALIQDMTVLENFFLGRTLATRHGIIDWTSAREEAKHWLEIFDIGSLVDVPLSLVTKSEQTIVAIARALSQGDGNVALLVLDEPTSSLPAAETQQLLQVMRNVSAQGIGILFVTHRLAEVMAVADELTVLRNGMVAFQASVENTDVRSIASAMAGAVLEDFESQARAQEENQQPLSHQQPLLSVSGLAGGDVQNLTFDLYPGEVVGIIGLLGSGIEDVGHLLTLRSEPTSGSVVLNGEALSAKKMTRVGYVPANRSVAGTLRGLTCRENASVTSLRSFLRRGLINRARETEEMRSAFEEMTVYPNEPEQFIESLSGGNQQKVLFARWLTTDAELLVAVEPTQGIDVHAKAQILKVLRERAGSGLGVILISGEPEEIVPSCDRVLVMNTGKVVGEFRAPVPVDLAVSKMNVDN